MRVLSDRARRRAAEQGGFTLVELLLTMTIGLLILGSATLIVIGATRHNTEVANRSDATQRGRLAMDRVKRDLRSAVCANTATLPVTYAGRDSIRFTADLSDGTRPVEQHTVQFAGRTLTDSVIRGSALTNPTFTGTAAVTTLATDVERRNNGSVFRYWAYPTTVPTSGVVEPNVELVPSGTSSLSAASMARIARIDINFATTGATTATRKIKAVMTSQVFMRTADPNAVIATSTTTSSTPPYDPTC